MNAQININNDGNKMSDSCIWTMPLIKLHLSGHTTSIRRKTKYYGIVNEIPNDFETTLETTLYSIIFFITLIGYLLLG